MAQSARLAAHWWSVPPTGRVSLLAGSDPELLGIALDPSPEGAPAVLRFRPAAGAVPGDQVSALLDEMERAAVALFPAWLPGAERLDTSTALGVPAVRSLAARVAARTENFGPFLADLAERALAGSASRTHFPAEVRARGLTRLIAAAYQKDAVVLLVDLPPGLSPVQERALVAAAQWLADHAKLTVWLAGAPLHAVDRLPTVTITLPEALAELSGQPRDTQPPESQPPESQPPDGLPPASGADRTGERPTFWYPPLSGLPRADSPAEQRLEKALSAHRWAEGRLWNHTYEPHILGRSYRLDVFWPAERLVVEVDGPEHRTPLRYADDRRRDVHLQLLGNVVLRFTNEDVLADVQAVVRTIRQLLIQRRHDNARPTGSGSTRPGPTGFNPTVPGPTGPDSRR